MAGKGQEERALGEFEHALARAQALASAAYETERRPREQLRAALAALLELCDREPALARALVVRSLHAGPRVAARRARVAEALAGALDAAGARMRDPGEGEPPPLSAQGVVAAVSGVVYARLLRGEEEEKEKEKEERKKKEERKGKEEEERKGKEEEEGPMAEEGLVREAGLAAEEGFVREAGLAAEEGFVRELLGPLMAMVVLPYAGAKAARRELSAPSARVRGASEPPAAVDPRRLAGALRGAQGRTAERMVCALAAIEQANGRGLTPSNGDVGWAIGDLEKSQVSRLLARLERAGLIESAAPDGRGRGGANAWRLSG